MRRKTGKFSAKSFLETVSRGKAAAGYKKDKPVFSQGDPADSVFYINKGKVKLTVVSEQGKEAVVAVLGGGDFLGEGSLAGQTLRMSTAMTMSDSMITCIRKADMIRALHDRVEFSEKFMEYVLARNVRIEADLVDQLFNSS